jgi:transcriptional antiterminator NusG
MEENTINPKVKWYIISCYSGHEDKVAELLRQAVEANDLQEAIPQVLVPSQEKIQVKDGKKKTIIEKVFPGYVLIQMEMNDETWNLVRNSEGVTKFLGTGRRPNPLSEDQVNSIIAYTQVKQPTFTSGYSVGDAVRVNDGPFKEFVGKISEINQDKGQVKVLLTVFGRETPVNMDLLQISKI